MARRSAPRGQNFLIDLAIAERIVSASEPDNETILEIGPGQGVLTRGLAARAARVVAWELDPRFVTRLQNEKIPRLEILFANAMKENWTRPEVPVVVSNLPYYITTPILFRLLDGEIPWRRAVIMVQAEVGMRLCARPGNKDFGLLTVTAGCAARIQSLFDVPPEAFDPVPQIVSRVLRFTPREDAPDAATRAKIRRIAQTAFSGRRKMLRVSLGPLARAEGVDLAAALGGISVAPTARPEEIGVDSWISLARGWGSGPTPVPPDGV